MRSGPRDNTPNKKLSVFMIQLEEFAVRNSVEATRSTAELSIFGCNGSVITRAANSCDLGT